MTSRQGISCTSGGASRPRDLGDGNADHVATKPADAGLAAVVLGRLTPQASFTAQWQKSIAPGKRPFWVDDVPPGDVDSHRDPDCLGVHLDVWSGHVVGDCPSSPPAKLPEPRRALKVFRTGPHPPPAVA
jgi:hypothetical protein